MEFMNNSFFFLNKQEHSKIKEGKQGPLSYIYIYIYIGSTEKNEIEIFLILLDKILKITHFNNIMNHKIGFLKHMVYRLFRE